MMSLTLIKLIAGMAGLITAGVIITFILLFITKKFKKSNQAKLAKELKQNKEVQFMIENIKQINNHLQLENTVIAKLLDAFNISKEDIDNYVLAQKSQRKALSKKDQKKATKMNF